MVPTRKIMGTIAGAVFLVAATMTQPAFKASAQQDPKQKSSFYVKGQSHQSFHVKPIINRNKLALSEEATAGSGSARAVAVDVPYTGVFPQKNREFGRGAMPIIDGGNHRTIPIPNAYRGDNCVPIPNVMQPKIKDSIGGLSWQMRKPILEEERVFFSPKELSK